MSAQHTPENLREFSRKHAPALAQAMTSLCGKVIAKGLQGVIQETCRLQSERDDLLADLREAATTLRRYEALHRAKNTKESTAKAEANAALAARFEATIFKATGSAS